MSEGRRFKRQYWNRKRRDGKVGRTFKINGVEYTVPKPPPIPTRSPIMWYEYVPGYRGAVICPGGKIIHYTSLISPSNPLYDLSTVNFRELFKDPMHSTRMRRTPKRFRSNLSL